MSSTLPYKLLLPVAAVPVPAYRRPTHGIRCCCVPTGSKDPFLGIAAEVVVQIKKADTVDNSIKVYEFAQDASFVMPKFVKPAFLLVLLSSQLFIFHRKMSSQIAYLHYSRICPANVVARIMFVILLRKAMEKFRWKRLVLSAGEDTMGRFAELVLVGLVISIMRTIGPVRY